MTAVKKNLDKLVYNPDKENIDFLGKTYNELKESE